MMVIRLLSRRGLHNLVGQLLLEGRVGRERSGELRGLKLRHDIFDPQASRRCSSALGQPLKGP